MRKHCRQHTSGKRWETLAPLIQQEFPNPSDLHILDVGCGSGELADLVTELGASYTGVDPDINSDDQIEIVRGCGSALPFDDRSFVGVILNKSLHHMPLELMGQALSEAIRVLHHNGRLLVIEPMLAGPAKEILSVVEDETEVLTASREALAAAAHSSFADLISKMGVCIERKFSSFDEYFKKLIAADGSRVVRAQKCKEALRRQFIAHTEFEKDLLRLRYDYDCWVFKRSNFDTLMDDWNE